jgi:phosphatidylglycerophosphatase A
VAGRSPASRFRVEPRGGVERGHRASGAQPARGPLAFVVRVLATLAGVGYMPIAPATWASLVVAVAAYLLVRAPLFGAGVAVAAIVSSLAGFWIAGRAERDLGHDAHPIVIDEVAGQLIALIWLPHTLQATALAFLFFRIFDVVKIEPGNAAQKLRGGFGVMTDDLIAGVYANLASRAALWAIGLAHHRAA